MAESVANHVQDKKPFDQLKEMIAEARLSDKMDRILLERYLKVSDNDATEAFALLKHGLELRAKTPYLFTNRDLSSDDVKTACTTFQFCPLKKLTKEKYKITIIRFHKCDTSVYSTVDVIKTALMMFDANYITYDYGEDGFPEGEIFLLDVVGFAFKQFLDVSYNVKTLIAYAKYLQEAAPVNLKFNHIANTSSVLDGVMSLLKPILRKDIAETVQFHKHGSESLLNFIDADVLPIDYGGTNGYIDDHFKEWLAVFQTRREYLLDDDKWKIPSDT